MSQSICAQIGNSITLSIAFNINTFATAAVIQTPVQTPTTKHLEHH